MGQYGAAEFNSDQSETVKMAHFVQKQAKKIGDGSLDVAAERTIRWQIRVTKMMSAVVFLTVFFVMIPYLTRTITSVSFSEQAHDQISPYLWSAYTLNSGINLIIYGTFCPFAKGTKSALVQ